MEFLHLFIFYLALFTLVGISLIGAHGEGELNGA
jgi:hypothetical protein